MIGKRKKFNFSPRTISSNKNKKISRIMLDNSSINSNEVIIKKNLFNKNNTCNNDDKNNEKSDIKYLITENEKENIDFISILLKLKGIQPLHFNNSNKNRQNNIKYVKTEEKTVEEKTNHKNYKKKISSKKEIGKIYNNKTTNLRQKNCIKEVTIDLMDKNSQDSNQKKDNKRDKKIHKKFFDNKCIKNELIKKRAKTNQNSPNKNLKSKIYNKNKNQNYKKEIENKKKQLLEGKPLNSNVQRKYDKYDKYINMNKNYIKNAHPGNLKKLNFHAIEKLEEYKAIKLNIQSYKVKTENIHQKYNEKIESYINNDIDNNQEEENNKFTITSINNNNSIFSSETLNNDIAILAQKNINSILSSNTLNNDLVNYISNSKRSLTNNNNLNNINNSLNTKFSIITNSLLNKDNNNDKNNEENNNFLIEINSNMNLNDREYNDNDISDTILSDNKQQFQQKINESNENENHNLDSFSQNEESNIEQFGINNIQKQNESKEIRLSQLKNKDINEGDNITISKSNMNLSISNLSKLTNFDDKKFYDKKITNNNLEYLKISKEKEGINIKQKQNEKLIKNKNKILNGNIINHDYFNLKKDEKSKEREPKDSIRKVSPQDNFKKRKINNKNDIFNDEDLSPTKKLINTNKKDVIKINSENIYKNIFSSKVIFNNEMKKINKRNKSKETTLKRYNLNYDNSINKKEYNFTVFSPLKKNNFENLNKNISINNNIIINYKN